MSFRRLEASGWVFLDCQFDGCALCGTDLLDSCGVVRRRLND
jgi:hypothetical protein